MTDEQLNGRFAALMAVVESLGRQIGDVKESLEWMNGRLDKSFVPLPLAPADLATTEALLDILHRVQALERKLEGKNGQS